MKMKRRRGPGSSAELTGSDDMDLLDSSDGHNDTPSNDVITSDSGAHGASLTNGSGNGHTKSNGSSAIMLPKRRRRPSTYPQSASTTVIEEEADTVVEAVPEPAPLLPRRRKAALAPIGDEAEPLTAPTAAVVPSRKLLGDGGGLRVYLTYQNIFWASLFILTVVTRLWDLGSRGIHHDESLHANFSYVLYDGRGYIHDPMMHGPLQFHLIAAMFWLFGATDATARFASVACGIFVVMSPFFLRRQMGQIAAMVCGALLFISPSVLYFSRMAREDAIFSGMEMIMLVGLWRFVSERKPTDFILFCAGLALMFTIKESAYLTLLILIGFFVVAYAVQAGYAALATLGGFGAALGALYLFVNGGMKSGSIPPLPDIPQVSPDFDTIWRFMGAFFAHPLVLGGLVLSVLFLISMTVLMRTQRGPSRPAFVAGGVPVRRAVTRGDQSQGIPTRRTVASGEMVAEVARPVDTAAVEGADDVLEDDDASPVYNPREMNPSPGSASARYQPGSIPHLIGALFSRPSVVLWGLGVALTIYVTLYTVFFTDIPRGLISGPFGSLGYWMAQHDVVRGDQPWYFYLLLIPLYEPVATFFAIAGLIFFTWLSVRWMIRRVRGDYERGEPLPQRLGMFNTERPVPLATDSSFLPAFIIAWMLGTLFIYSWAGEKMPWLMMHMVRPAIFLASLFIGALIVSLIKRRRERLIEAGVEVDGEQTQRTALPQRRRTGGKLVEQPMYAKQDPPWVTWSRPGSRFPLYSYLTIFVLLTLGWGLKMNAVTYFTRYDAEWGMTWLFPLFILLATIGYAVWLGPGRVFRYMALGILTVGLMYQFRSAINLSYNQPDVPVEMATYVQTSPYVVDTVRNLETFADVIAPGVSYPAGAPAGPRKNLKVMYDEFTSWPMEWYLRDFDKTFIGDGEANPDENTTVLLLEWAQHNNKTNLTDKYVGIQYPMRWWFPEEWYKEEFIPNRFVRDANGNAINDPESKRQDKRRESPLVEQIGGALGTIRATVTEPQLQATLWKYLVFRETPKPLGSQDMVLFVRKDVAPLWNRIQYKPSPPSTDVLPRTLPDREWWLTDIVDRD